MSDPGTPDYERARLRLADELRSISRDAYHDMADDLMEGDLMQVPVWVVLQLMAKNDG